MSGVAGYYKADEVRRAANGRWADVLGRCGVDTSLLSNRHGPCPGCGGRDRFRYDDKDGDGTFICSQGGGGMISGDGIALLMHVTGKEWKDCLAMAGDIVLGEAGRHARREGAGRDAGVKPAPKPAESWIPAYSESRLRAAVKVVPEGIDEKWFMERSEVDVRGMTAGKFLEWVFEPGERVIVFTEFRGPGDFLWQVGRGGYRLSKTRGVKAVRSDLPSGGPEGVWYLCNPVDGQWYPNPRQEGKYSRRSAESVTGWRHLVLENDQEKTFKKKSEAVKEAARLKMDPAAAEAMFCERVRDRKWAAEVKDKGHLWESLAVEYMNSSIAAPGLWFRFLAMAPLAIVAIYSSGGNSWHALVKVDQHDQPSFDSWLRSQGKRVLPIFGADAAAMTPVRLTRLPCTMRGGREQKLIYLRPRPPVNPVEPIITLAKRRGI